MTQPQTSTSPDSRTGEVLAAGAIALALIAVETKVKQQVDDAITAAYTTIAAAGVLAASTAPATVTTGIALLSLAKLHKVITASLANAQQQVTDSITSGYHAASTLALTKLKTDLDGTGYTIPDDLPELGDNLNRLTQDVTTMFGHAQTDLQNSMAAAYDGIHGDDPAAARTVAIRQAVIKAQARTAQRANASAAVAVQQGSTDTQQAIYNDYQTETGTTGLMKRWKTTSSQPCGMCRALNGTLVGINASFDESAGNDTTDWRQPWRTMLTPPRHPNCRCQLEMVRT